MRPRHPSEPSRQLVRGLALERRHVGLGSLVSGLAGQQPIGLACHRRRELVAGRHVQDLARLPARHAVASVVGRDLVLHQRGVPLVGEDRRPEQPQTLLRVEEQRRVRIRIARRVRQQEGGAPRAAALAEPRAPDHDVVRRALTRPVEPAHEEIPAWQLDHRRRVVVPVFERKDELRGMERTVGGLARHDRNAADRKRENLPKAWHARILPAEQGRAAGHGQSRPTSQHLRASGRVPILATLSVDYRRCDDRAADRAQRTSDSAVAVTDRSHLATRATRNARTSASWSVRKAALGDMRYSG